MPHINGEQTINGKLGEIWINLDGEIRLAMEVKKIEAKVSIEQKEVPVLGDMGTPNKYTGWKGSGTMTCYYMTSYFRKAMLAYIRTGVAPSLTLTITVDDEGSGRGVERTTLGKVTIDSIDIAKLDAENTVLEESIPFKFSEVLNYEPFNDL